ncbi:hypothetical protein ACQPZF_36145 [Actinosynnema sp. CS-041913]|uniref:hypothetical protein n=1 Tax=Actinosynnema sp. CS-041913 TaxID=3239917 RepID=UPI003D8A1AC9
MSNYIKHHSPSEDRLLSISDERLAWRELESTWTSSLKAPDETDYGTPAEVSFDYGIGRLLHAWQECRIGWRKMIKDNHAGYERVRSGFDAIGQAVQALATPKIPMVILRHAARAAPLDFNSAECGWDEDPYVYFRQGVFLAVRSAYRAAEAIESWTELEDSSEFIRLGVICQGHLDAAVAAIDKGACFRVLDSVHEFLRESGYMPKVVDAEAMLRRINRKYEFEPPPHM